MHSRIVGTGGYLPAQVLTNAELSRRIATSDEWVRGRTGITQRCIAATDEQTSDLALAASRQALAAAGITPADLDLIVVATTNGRSDYLERRGALCVGGGRLNLWADPRL